MKITEATVEKVVYGVLPVVEEDANIPEENPSTPISFEIPSMLPTLALELAKPRLLSSGVISSAAKNTISLGFYFGAIWLNLTQVFNILSRYQYWRGTLCFRVRVIGTPYGTGKHFFFVRSLASIGASTGSYAFVNDNIAITTERDGPIFYEQHIEAFPGIELYPNKSGDFELKVPYSNNLPFYNTKDNSVAVVGVITGTPNASVSTTETADMHVSIFGWVEDLEVCAPVLQSEKTGAISNLAGKAVKTLGGWASEYASRKVTAGLALAGLGSPLIEPPNAVERPVPPTNSDSQFYGVSLSQHRNPEAPLPSGPDEMNVAYTCGFPSVMSINGVADGTSNVNVWNGSICPVFDVAVQTGPPVYRLFSRPGFIANVFDLYGFDEIEVTVEPITNSFQRGTIRVAFLPNKETTLNPYVFTQDLGDSQYAVLDINSGEKLVTSFKWCYPYAYQKVGLGSFGLITLDVLGAIKSAGVNVSLHVSYRYKGFRLANYRGYNPLSSTLTSANYVPGDVAEKLQSGFDPCESLRDLAKLPRPFGTFGTELSGAATEQSWAIFPIDNKPYCLVDLSDDLPLQALTSTVGTAQFRATPVYLVSQLFKYMSGSLRYTILNYNNAQTGTAGSPVMAFTTNRLTTQATPYETATVEVLPRYEMNLRLTKSANMTYRKPDILDNSLTFSVPMRYNGSGMPSKSTKFNRLLRGDGVTVYFCMPVAAGSTLSSDNQLYFQSGGDDFSCFVRSHTPTITLVRA